ncbi:MAG TPA: 16S rRNA (guanine(966)-N(2))-methyltransferase RsmD [Acidobacteriota bacterium]|nr:16S rRNA (guanine(966)-N(2))-methyltransferase RsmD [Acidobacteriota bacterium]HQF86209.1 16S rRNA (guanine(966)-N(2))-methyltransferase RsmD [Acidobacteriota bacterium]HQG90547.1 16S rRNA (guanine(966)-N(2))-methyltransferase RsmD [Acidobacteriota bacterium]HQK87698.1 16S rRNA (guanine(966)-N(2))-methyltransferase RsmD [Acidobacteriota bacterium]
MRIIAGRLRGRQLFLPPDLSIRPTIGKLRECYFDIVRDLIGGARFLDLCAGSGSMGLEALSRGAAEVVFVEMSERSLKYLRKNLAHCRVEDGVRVIRGDVLVQIPRLARDGKQFDLIYFDPPYFEGLYDKALAVVAGSSLLAPGGLVTVNHFKKVMVPAASGGLECVRTVRHGDSALSFYVRRQPPDSDS